MPDRTSILPFSSTVQPLSDFAAGEGAVIATLTGGRKLNERLAALGLFPGQRLTVCQNNGSSLIIKLNGNRLALGYDISQRILATPGAHDCHQNDSCLCPIKDNKK